MRSFSFCRWGAVGLIGLLLVVPGMRVDAAAPSAKDPMLSVSVDQGVSVGLAAPAASVFIANPEVADVQVMSPTSLMVFGRKMGQTTLMASDNAGRTLLLRTVLVTHDLDNLRLALRAVIPNNKIGVEAVPNGIVLTGEAKDAATVEDARRVALRYVPKESGEVINRIKVHGSNQIHIRVRFAEVSRDADKRFGIDWESAAEIGGISFGLAAGAGILPTVPGTSLPYYPQGNVGSSLLSRTRSTVGGSVNDILSFSNDGVNGMVDALAEDGLVTVLAEPNLTAMSGETASFLAGGEFPIPVPQSNQAIGVEWKTYGVSLAFTPTLIGEDRISLHVRPEVSQLSDAGSVTLNNTTIPALATRRAETTIELASGQSFAIGGLLNNSQNQAVSKFPFLGDVPILGALFRSTRFQNNETELVIIITPYLVRPVSNELALPTDGFSAPSDIDQYLMLRQTNSDPNARTISGQARAVKVDPPPIVEEAPAPAASPVAPVSNEAKPKEDPKPAEAKMSLPVEPKKEEPAPSPPPQPAKPTQPPQPPQPLTTTVKPADPPAAGGFILE